MKKLKVKAFVLALFMIPLSGFAGWVYQGNFILQNPTGNSAVQESSVAVKDTGEVLADITDPSLTQPRYSLFFCNVNYAGALPDHAISLGSAQMTTTNKGNHIDFDVTAPSNLVVGNGYPGHFLIIPFGTNFPTCSSNVMASGSTGWYLSGPQL